MHNSYFLLRLLAKELQEKLAGMQLIDCYSQDKDELILVFGNADTTFYIKAILTGQFTALSFPAKLHRAKANSVTLFESVLSERVLNVQAVHCDRSFVLQLTHDKSLIFKMHGNRANILLAVNDVVQDVFKHSLSKDLTLQPNTLAKSISFAQDVFLEHKGSIQSLYPVFDKELLQKIQTAEFMQADKATQWLKIEALIKELNSGNIYVQNDAEQKPTITLCMPEGPYKLEHSAVEALNHFVKAYLPKAAFISEKQRLTNLLKRKIAQTQAYISELEAQIKALQAKPDYRLLADIIMANLHNIPEQAETATLHDFVNDRPISITFKQGVSPIKTAEWYYKKAKNSHLHPQQLNTSLEQKVEDLMRYESWLLSLAEVSDLKTLRKHAVYDLFNTDHSKEQGNQKNSIGKHEEFEGYSIIVGTSSKVNDLLLAAARKDDWWFHARNFAGSHVWVAQIFTRSSRLTCCHQ